MNPIQILKRDHGRIRSLFRRFDNSVISPPQARQRLFDQLKHELDIHMDVEEQIFYPAMSELKIQAADDLLREAIDEHAVIRDLLTELEAMNVEDDAFAAKMRTVRDDVEHHLEIEELELFPHVKALDAARVKELGQAVVVMKKTLPVRH